MNYMYLNKILFECIDDLFTNQNNTNILEHKYLFCKKEYYELLKTVVEIIQENKYISITDIRHQLYEKSGLKEAMHEIVYKRSLTPGLVINFGTEQIRDIVLCGNKEEVKLKNNQAQPFLEEVKTNTIYDLASTSKIFTAIAIYKLVELKLLELHKPITEYVPQFINLKNVTVYDLLKFKVDVITKIRIDSAKSKIEAENILFNSIINPHPNTEKAYGDIGSMVLKYIVESVSKISFDEFIQAIIFLPCKMQDTHLHVPKEKINQLASNNFNAIVDKFGNIVERKHDFKGVSHDAKAKIMKSDLGNAPGHAGYFSNTPDMIKFGNALLNNQIISQESLFQINDNEVGVLSYDSLGNKHFNHYFGSLVYLKQLNPEHLSVHLPLSGRTFMSPGYAGTTFCIDPLNKISMFLGSNRLHNRIYQIPDEYIQIDDQFKKYYQNKTISASFTKDKEIIVRAAMNLSIQYKFLEKLYQPKENLSLVRKI